MLANFQIPELLETQGLILLLKCANIKLKTHYRLGFINQGYQTKWVEKDKAYDYEYVSNHTPVDQSTTGMPGDGAGERWPMIWLHNDNAQAMMKDHRQFKDAIPHWCSLTTGKGVKKSDARLLKTYRDNTDAWGLNDAAKAQVRDGVWIVHSENLHVEGRNEYRGEITSYDNNITVRKGQFMRKASPPRGFVVPDNCFYMSNTNDNNTGLVPTSHLTKLEVGGRFASDNRRLNPASRAAPARAPSDDFDIYQALLLTGVSAKDRFVDGFAYSNGDFLLKQGAQGDRYFVTDIDGDSGEAIKTRLTKLKNPYVFPHNTYYKFIV